MTTSDVDYMRLTVALTLILVVIFVLYCKEKFAPYPSILNNVNFRSEASHDPRFSKIDNPPMANFYRGY